MAGRGGCCRPWCAGDLVAGLRKRTRAYHVLSWQSAVRCTRPCAGVPGRGRTGSDVEAREAPEEKRSRRASGAGRCVAATEEETGRLKRGGGRGEAGLMFAEELVIVWVEERLTASVARFGGGATVRWDGAGHCVVLCHRVVPYIPGHTCAAAAHARPRPPLTSGSTSTSTKLVLTLSSGGAAGAGRREGQHEFCECRCRARCEGRSWPCVRSRRTRMARYVGHHAVAQNNAVARSKYPTAPWRPPQTAPQTRSAAPRPTQ
jgi:hypothetical protein